MTITRLGALSVLALAAGLAACDRSDPPSQRIERAAEDAIEEVQGETLPTIAEGPYAPRDECLDQPGASEFLLSLRNAVKARDTEALLALAADDVFLDFGGGSGKDLLRERMAADDGFLWGELNEILTLGCASDGASMTLPWYFAQDIPVDPFDGQIVTGEDVPLRAGPNAEAEELARISWDVVEWYTEVDPDARFVPVRWNGDEDGEPVEGFIELSKLRSIVDYRVGVSRRNDRWRITNFVAGD